MKTYRVLHNWADDEQPTEYLVSCDHRPSKAEVIAACKINFEADRGEWLDIKLVKVYVITKGTP